MPKISTTYYISMDQSCGGYVRITANERRTILKLLNVSEAARHIGVGIQQLHRDIRAGRVQSPQIHIGRREYFSEDEMKQLAMQYDKGQMR